MRGLILQLGACVLLVSAIGLLGWAALAPREPVPLAPIPAYLDGTWEPASPMDALYPDTFTIGGDPIPDCPPWFRTCR